MKHAFGLVAFAIVGSALGQSSGDYRVEAPFRVTTPALGGASWAAGQSVGGVDFRVHSRYLAVYYGGVLRQDNFTFSVQIDFRDIPGFAANFVGSPYDTDYDVYLNNGFVGRATMDLAGLAELAYQSRHPTPPELPVPENWPSPISPGSPVRAYAAAAQLPAIGDGAPVGAASMFVPATLEERFVRADANHDGHVDLDDYTILAASYDPQNLVGPHVGPAAGDFTGDNRADRADYDALVVAWDDHDEPPAEPGACMGAPTGPVAAAGCLGGSAGFTAAGAGAETFSYRWRKDGAFIAGNATAFTPTLSLTGLRRGDAGSYDCVISNGCGSVTTAAAPLTICAADFNCDAFVDFFDYDGYISAFETGAPGADFNGDGFVDFFDYDDFVLAYETGC